MNVSFDLDLDWLDQDDLASHLRENGYIVIESSQDEEVISLREAIINKDWQHCIVLFDRMYDHYGSRK